MLAKKGIPALGEGTDAATVAVHGNNKELIFKKYVPFSDYISEINNAQLDSTKNLDVVMPI